MWSLNGCAPFCVVLPDSSGAGDSVNPKYLSGFWLAIGNCLSCPICTGTHAAGVMFGLLALFPQAIVLFYILGVAGLSEGLHWVFENQEWSGRAARESAGTAWLAKNENV